MFGVSLGVGIKEGAATEQPSPVSDWLLATGLWNDAGFWRDDQSWIG